MVRNADRSLRSLVDVDNGMISREVYTSDEIYRQEQEQIFMRAWLFVGHESMVPNPGDFAASRMGAEEVLLVRDRKGKIHVFLNTCRHRGMKVCRYDSGNALVFTCPFHAWSYDTDGRLIGVGHQREAYGEDFDKSEWPLHEVAQMCNFYGSIWATWDRPRRASVGRCPECRVTSLSRHPEAHLSGCRLMGTPSPEEP